MIFVGLSNAGPRSSKRTGSCYHENPRWQVRGVRIVFRRSWKRAVTKNGLVKAVASHGFSQRESYSLVEWVFAVIAKRLEKGEEVKIVGFGRFRLRRKAMRPGRNPQTGEPIQITARRVLTFKPSKELKQRIVTS